MLCDQQRVFIVGARRNQSISQGRPAFIGAGVERAFAFLEPLHAAPVAGNLTSDHGQREGDEVFRSGNFELLFLQRGNQTHMHGLCDINGIDQGLQLRPSKPARSATNFRLVLLHQLTHGALVPGAHLIEKIQKLFAV